VFHDGDAVAQLLGLVQVMSAQKDGALLIMAQVSDQVLDLPRRHGIEPGGRLVQEEELGTVDQCSRQGQALLHALAVVACLLVSPVCEVKDLQQACDAGRDLAPRHAVQRGIDLKVFPARQALIEGRGLGQDPGALAQRGALVHRRQPQHLGCARGRGQHPVQQPDGRRLAGAVVAEEAEHLACLDLQGQTVHCNSRPEVAGQPVGDESRNGSHGALLLPSDWQSCAQGHAPAANALTRWIRDVRTSVARTRRGSHPHMTDAAPGCVGSKSFDEHALDTAEDLLQLPGACVKKD
jgi:hypothetical protein